MTSDVVLFSGNAHPSLSKKISDYLHIPVGKAVVSQFSDGESRVELHNNVRGRDVFIVQSTSYPANHHIMEALVIVDACRRASAQNITLLTPYFGYARQDRKTASRTPISAKLVAELFEAAGIDRLLALELHNSAIQGFFNVPVDHLFSKSVFYQYITTHMPIKDLLVISPDAGGVERSRAMAKKLNTGLAIIDKRRDKPNESEVLHIIGNVKGKHCLIVDDMVDTGGSLVKASQALIENGAKSASAAITHPVLSGSAVSLIAESPLSTLVVTDSIPLSPKAQQCDKIVQISIAQLMGEAIRRVHHRDSVSSLFI